MTLSLGENCAILGKTSEWGTAMIRITTKWLQYDNSTEKITDGNDYEIKLKNVKSRMRIRYFVILVVMLLLIFLTNRTSGDATFVQQITFGATLVSMILSVFAIAVSVRRELKSEQVNRTLEEKASLLNQSSARIISAVEEAENYTRLLRAQYEELEQERRALEEEREKLAQEREALEQRQEKAQEEDPADEKQPEEPEKTESGKTAVIERNIA